ncbi:MAG TPA: hypothetical protein VGB24_04475 [Longimicrobium sp.]|jgi:hypothetical protein|uniref:hypothetical protein n=1 Tax=Longimicrobium sp. TaxID=2029185 RepID=UPI002ED974CA
MTTDLLEPVVDDGVRLTHFFNGRVLTAEDLKREQDALRGRHRGLAGALGEGVVRGMEVTVGTPTLSSPPSGADTLVVSGPTVSITPGLAFNLDGDPVALPQPVELRLTPGTAAEDAAAGLFAACTPASAEISLTNAGFYLLSARPATAFSRERAAAVDYASDGTGAACGSRFTQEGASFSLVPIPLPSPTPQVPLSGTLSTLLTAVNNDVEKARRNDTTDPGLTPRLTKGLSKLRSAMAYWCMGWGRHDVRVAALAVGGASPGPLTPIDALRQAGQLSACDVPLAVLFVSRRQLEFVDMWSVRRMPSAQGGQTVFGIATGALPRSESAAMFLQFRDHASTFFGKNPVAEPDTVVAREWFVYLPPVGILPVQAGGQQERIMAVESTQTMIVPTEQGMIKGTGTGPPVLPGGMGAGAAAASGSTGFEPFTFFEGISDYPWGPTAPAEWVTPLVGEALQDVPSLLTDAPELRFYYFGEQGQETPYLMFRTYREQASQFAPIT